MKYRVEIEGVALADLNGNAKAEGPFHARVSFIRPDNSGIMWKQEYQTLEELMSCVTAAKEIWQEYTQQIWDDGYLRGKADYRDSGE